MTIRLFASAVLATAALSTPSFALEAMRCNVQTQPGLFQPVLRIVTQGKMQDIRMGEQGLTRTMFYRDAKVLSFVATMMDMPSHLMPSSVSGVCGAVEASNGLPGGNGGGGVVAVVAPTVTAPAEPAIPETAREADPEYPEGDFDGIESTASF